MTDDPLGNIEEEKTQQDIGVFAYRIYTGARTDGATRHDALAIVTAWFIAFLRSNDIIDETT